MLQNLPANGIVHVHDGHVIGDFEIPQVSTNQFNFCSAQSICNRCQIALSYVVKFPYELHADYARKWMILCGDKNSSSLSRANIEKHVLRSDGVAGERPTKLTPIHRRRTDVF